MTEIKKNPKQSVPVLMYHHVTPEGGSLSCSVRNFDSQLKGLVRQGYSTLTAEQFAGFLKGEAVPKKSVVLTFDDGYLNNFVYAHPILKKYKLNALCFLITQHIHEGAVRPVMGSSEILPNSYGHYECKQLIADGRADEVMLRWEEVREMQRQGTFSFHSHTHTHIRWDLSEDAANKNIAIRNDLLLGQEQFKLHLGEVSDHHCWPQGYFDADYARIAQELGFKHLYTTEPYGFNVAQGDPAHIYRIAAKNKSGLWLIQRLWWGKNSRAGQWYNRQKLKKRACASQA